MRLNQAIQQTGKCSRRQADEWIKEGRITVDGRMAVLGMMVDEQATICLDGLELVRTQQWVTLLYNKPLGIECTTDQAIPHNIIDAIGFPQRIFPIGRLDKDSQGLILLTNDGNLVNPILRAENKHEKEYEVKVNKLLTSDFLHALEKGVEITNMVKNERVITQAFLVKQLGDKHFTITLTQGYHRQIRKMTQALGYRVVHLRRIRIMNFKLGKLKLGSYRILSDAELKMLKEALT